MKKLTIWIAFLLIAIVLGACGTSEVSGAAETISGQVADYDGPAGALEATDDFTETNIGTGSIQADGRFSLELDPSVPETALQSVAFLASCDDIAISDPEANISALGVLDVANGDETGYLALANSAAAAQGRPGTLVGWFYVDRNVSVQGKCVSDGVNVFSDVEIDLELKRGWNVYTVAAQSDPDAVAGISGTFTSGMASGVAWYYVSGEDSGSSDPPPAPTILSGQAQNYEGPARTLTATDFFGTTLGTGTLEADGNFSLELEASVAEDAREPVTSLATCPDITFSDPDALMTSLANINVTDEGEVVGYLYTDIYTSRSASSLMLLQRIYVDREVAIKGECPASDGAGDLSVNLELQAGWNIITVEERYTDTTSSSTLTSGVAPGTRINGYFPANDAN